jgi:hypothetical protein
MKEQLKVLYKNSKREYDVWSYLWIFSEKNKVSFTYTSLSSQFNIPVSTLHRIINKNITSWALQGIDISISKSEYKSQVIYFKSKKIESKVPLNEELYAYLKQYYSQIEYDYPDLDKHKRYINTICNKLKKAMQDKGTIVDENNLYETFIVFISNIDGWWKESGNITLPLISKHFTKILNQVKNNANGKKRDNYSIAANKADEINFDKLTRK